MADKRGRKTSLPVTETSEVKLLKFENANEVTKSLTRLASMPLNEMISFSKDFNNAALDLLCARVFIEGIKEGDHQRCEMLLKRIAGPVKEQIDLNFSGGLNVNKFIVDYIEQLEETNKSHK